MTSEIITYTHWSYFADRQSAQNVADELGDVFATRIHPPVLGVTMQANDRKSARTSVHFRNEPNEWLLLAARPVALDNLFERHDEVEVIVNRHGGIYDGGEVTYLRTGETVADMLDRP